MSSLWTSECVPYTKMFKESPNMSGETMSMDNVVKLCRELGWPEEKFSADTIKTWAPKEGPLNCEEFLKMFEPKTMKKDLRKAKYRRNFIAMDIDKSGKLSVEELTKLFLDDPEDDVTLETATNCAKNMMEFADADGKGGIDLEEFLNAM